MKMRLDMSEDVIFGTVLNVNWGVVLVLNKLSLTVPDDLYTLPLPSSLPYPPPPSANKFMSSVD